MNLINVLYYSYCAFLAVSVIFLLILFFKFHNRSKINKRYDKELNVITTGFRKSSDNPEHHRTESTPYSALKSLHAQYPISKEKRLVDFGSGKGRVTIALAHFYGIKTVGIELNLDTLMDATTNVVNYERKHPSHVDLVEFENGYAERYKIKEEDSVFFFFNPFDVSIFKNVVLGIQNDAIKNNKKSEIILYYPTKKYVKHLEKNTNFKLKKEIKVEGSIFPLEKILIYEIDWNRNP